VEHDKHVMEMNETHRPASGPVQRAAPKVANMINEPGHPTGYLLIPRPKEETTMFKTISAALLAVSLIAAPAMAASSDKTTQAPAAKTAQAPAAKIKQVKPSALNSNARMGDHHKHFRHHRFHKNMSALKTHKISKVTIKHPGPATKRG
jgi:hypothetical protein